MATAPSAAAVPIARLAALAIACGGFVVAALLIAFGPVAVDALGLTGGTHGALWDECVFTAAIFGAMLGLACVGGTLTGFWPLALGGEAGKTFGLGIVAGLAGIMAATGFAWLAGLIVPAPSQRGAAILLGVIVVLLQVVAEESYFRGWLQPLLARTWGSAVAVPVVAVGFAALHLLGGAGDVVTLVNLLLGGLAFGLLAARAGGIAPAVGMHLAWNGTEQLLLGLDPNPGVGGFGALLNVDLVGSPLWGGSAEGLNASLGMTAALLAILAPLLVYVPRRSKLD